MIESYHTFLCGVDSPVSIASFTTTVPTNNNISAGHNKLVSPPPAVPLLLEVTVFRFCGKRRPMEHRSPTNDNSGNGSDQSRRNGTTWQEMIGLYCDPLAITKYHNRMWCLAHVTQGLQILQSLVKPNKKGWSTTHYTTSSMPPGNHICTY
jgi:hypothetical protein